MGSRRLSGCARSNTGIRCELVRGRRVRALHGSRVADIHHWLHALPSAELSWLLPASNLDAGGPAAVGQNGAMNYSGTFDMTGNVREWSASARGDRRAISRGSTDQASMATTKLTPRRRSIDRRATACDGRDP